MKSNPPVHYEPGEFSYIPCHSETLYLEIATSGIRPPRNDMEGR